MSSPVGPTPSADPSRLREVLRACAAAARDFWQGYWDRPIGC